MINVDEYENFNAVGLAVLIADKEVSSLEAVEPAFFRIESRNSAPNVVIDTLFDNSRLAAGSALPRDPLFGASYFVKDLNTARRHSPND